MQLLWPGFLLLLGAIPLLIAAYVWVLRRRRRFVVRYSSLSLVRAALPRAARLRRHLPFALFLAALASLITALGRPVATIQVPVGQATIVLALDVSRSMLAEDITPSRIAAAQEAAKSFVASQERGTQIGIVAFAGFAEMVQAPTTEREALDQAIVSLNTGRGTAIGSGILEAIDVIAGVNQNVAPSQRGSRSAPALGPAPDGSHVADIIVMLTDGVNSTGPLPLDAAQQAVERGVRIYTIGFGTENGGFGGGQGGGLGGPPGGFRRGIDEATLQRVAEMTGGEYYTAESASELQQVFRELPISYSTRAETMEVSVVFTALAAILVAVSVGLSLAWNRLF